MNVLPAATLVNVISRIGITLKLLDLGICFQLGDGVTRCYTISHFTSNLVMPKKNRHRERVLKSWDRNFVHRS